MSAYVLDVPYVRTFLEDLGPARLRLVAAVNGLSPPPAEDFDHADLGCGFGDTTLTLAAAYPKARLYGVDINPAHVAAARALALRGALPNAHFFERDFTRLRDDELPPLDYACTHGVLSWVAPETRAALLSVAAKRLKPGGLFYVGYNSLPGWAVIEPLRRLLVDGAQAAKGSTTERAQAAFDLAKRLSAAGSRYFARNAPAADMLATMEKAGLPYVVHEFLHEHWAPMYFADLAREMEARDLHFVGQLPLYLNDRELAVPPGTLGALPDAGDRIAFESLMGYATNQFFRRDVFVKGRPAASAAATDDYLDATPFAPLAAAGIARAAHLAYHAVHYVGELFDALVPALHEGAQTAAELAARPDLARFGVTRVRGALLRLLMGGQIAPMLRATRAVAGHEAPYRVPSAYNRAVLRQPATSGAPRALASPAAGTGIVVTSAQAAGLLSLADGRDAHAQAAGALGELVGKLAELGIVETGGPGAG